MTTSPRDKIWRKAAKKNGLTFDEAAGVMTGKLVGGSSVLVGIVEPENGWGLAILAFTPPLDLFWDEAGPTELLYADGRFTPSHPRGDALLDEPLKRALDRLAVRGRVTLRLVCVRILLTSDVSELAELNDLLDALRETATSLERRRDFVPVEPALAPFEGAVQSLADELGLRVTRSPLGLAGSIGGSEICAWMWKGAPNDLFIEVAAPGAESLDPELKLETHAPSLLERWGVFRQGDPEIGDKELDKHLTVATSDIEALKRRLGPEELDALRTLLAGGHLRVGEGYVRLERAKLAEAATATARSTAAPPAPSPGSPVRRARVHAPPRMSATACARISRPTSTTAGRAAPRATRVTRASRDTV